jgi:hypothetical protein
MAEAIAEGVKEVGNCFQTESVKDDMSFYCLWRAIIRFTGSCGLDTEKGYGKSVI